MADDLGDENLFDPSMKKKKKSKKKTAFDLEAENVNENTNDREVKEDEVDDEGDKKDEGMSMEIFGKKKKKKKVFNMDDIKSALPDENGDNLEDDEEHDKLDENLDLNLDFSMTKKKRKKKKDFDQLVAEEEMKEDDDEVDSSRSKGWLNTSRDYTYDELLERVFNIMREKNPDALAGEKRRFVMRPPQVVKVGTKKTSFANFSEICRMVHRQPKHLLQFLLAELGTSGSVDGNSQLIIKGRFQQKQIENVLRRYIKEYVTCHTCKSPETILSKDTRLFFLQCETCGSRCSVASIKSGYQAVTGKRAAARAKNA